MLSPCWLAPKGGIQKMNTIVLHLAALRYAQTIKQRINTTQDGRQMLAAELYFSCAVLCTLQLKYREAKPILWVISK
jgi:uncharacterized protein YwgA